MKVVTNDYKNAIKNYGREIDIVLIYDDNGTTITLGNEDINSIDLHYDGNILKSVMKQLDINSNVEISKETIIRYKYGIKVRNNVVLDYRDNYDYIEMGYYIVNKVEKQEDTNSYLLTCYDKMLYFMVNYENSNITYPITIRNYLSAICTKMNVTFASSTDNFVNYNQQLTEELYLDSNGNSMDYTFRDVLDELAEVTASTICINDSGELEVRYITNTNVTISEDEIRDINVNFGEKYGAINTVVLSRSNGLDKISKSIPANLPDEDKIAIEIAENQILNTDDRSNYIDEILNKLYGLEYYINDYETIGITYLDVCDRYSVEIGETTYSCIMLNDDINQTSGLKESIYTEKPKEAEQEYKYMTETDKNLRNAEIIIDKKIGEVDIKGKTINLTADNIAISSTNFSVTKDGTITATNANISGAITSSKVNIGGGTINLFPIYETGTTIIPYVQVNAGAIGTPSQYYGRFTGQTLTFYRPNGTELSHYGASFKASNGELNYLETGNIDAGSGSCSSNGYTQIYFNKTFAEIPSVVCTCSSNTSGVIAIKTRNITKIGFEATIGGSGFSTALSFDWIAIYKDNGLS